ncbi:outer membrane beta-barrel protein [Pontibacter harenae]|uniref:outer membrane beta-barrel protein n=1 Tax=Pontibacter harenae TaxID=2894083 RepID=UPI001E5DA7E6|nr:outer membrane beta-barrel protein [Pontibacter harenae]MCC9165495.1 PorT family protein [Pontibacter harenae]
MKRIFIILIALLTYVGAQAQTDNLRLGAKIGLNMANLSNDATVSESDAAVGTEFGVYGRIGDFFYVQPGLDFVTNKVNLIRTMQPATRDRDALRVRYLRVPVLFGIQTEANNSFLSGMRYMAGPSFAYALGVADNTIGIRRDDITKAQFALNAGIGINLWILEADLMYSHGFTEVMNNNNSGGKYRNLSITVGASF